MTCAKSDFEKFSKVVFDFSVFESLGIGPCPASKSFLGVRATSVVQDASDLELEQDQVVAL